VVRVQVAAGRSVALACVGKRRHEEAALWGW